MGGPHAQVDTLEKWSDYLGAAADAALAWVAATVQGTNAHQVVNSTKLLCAIIVGRRLAISND